MNEDQNKIYTNGEISVHWKKELCKHSANCFRGLPKVFDPRKRPWIMMNEATSTEIINQVQNCPSGALSMTK